MTQKDLETYIVGKWGPPNKTIREISMSGGTIPLVDSDEMMYCFDDICKAIYSTRSLPTSADGLVFKPTYIQLIEFKSGFKDKITKENFNPEEAKCEYKGDACDDYWGLFRKVRKLEKDELIDSLRLKAIESYIALENCLFPYCSDFSDKKLGVRLLIVIDAEETDAMEDMLATLAKKKPGKENMLKKVRKAVSRLINQEDISGRRFYYDAIEVISAQEFQKRLV